MSYTRHVPLLFLVLCAAWAQPRPEVLVAAASNLTQVLREAGPAFEAETGIHPVFSFGSTAQLAQQVENGAPFDVFLAADDEHVEQLARKGVLDPASLAVYARGTVALWIPSEKPGVRRMEDLALPEIKVIAVAKPELAPYGAAAVAALKNAGVWNQVQSKIVYAENISMARQYGALRNADAVLTAAALVRQDGGAVIPVDPALYPPIDQSLGIVARSANPAAARAFVNYLLRGKGRDALARAGYLVR